MRNTIKKLFALVIAFVLTVNLTMNAGAVSITDFSDVRPGRWYYSAVEYAVSEGLFSGTSATTFSPDAPMTRGMFVKVLANKAGIDTSQYVGTSFSDVGTGAWYTAPVEWAAEHRIVSGIGNGQFAPNKNVTREQMAVILYNYAEYAGCDLTTRAGLLEQFSDGGKVSHYAKYAMEWALTHKLLAGSVGRLNPQGTATRAQVAQVFMNAHDLLSGSDSPQEPTVTPAPTSSPYPDAPGILITDEVRAKLKPNQDPEKLLDYVLNGKNDDPTFSYDGTTAKWDPSLVSAEDVGMSYAGCWEDSEHEARGTDRVANGFVQRLTRTASDRFYITAEEADGCFCLYYHSAEKPDGGKMRQVKSALNLPGSKKLNRALLLEGAGWAGPMEWGVYNGAPGIARKVEYYLLELHSYTTCYYLSEPEPGVFYLFYN